MDFGVLGVLGEHRVSWGLRLLRRCVPAKRIALVRGICREETGFCRWIEIRNRFAMLRNRFFDCGTLRFASHPFAQNDGGGGGELGFRGA